ncbi:SDR family NAD(P)-dependent oxidoreductase [Sphingomonas sp. 2R-10]|uniref:SDR family NAD(P)-dependent oxidoreductase n=1 Tax=Sphingomonas sp. 2R-10 TaxID=3045148 RepID=UPI000F79067F|nr:SDR family NAD(P)-dependent oxidoreductase [Sphingomonas sp. 2R-10]MDJ0276214.1 SDR family NAD(P)-dependent oxidoreductase [Sphingomonas sp. 2R-10]
MSKVWFITGAGSGLGAGTARAALQNGDRVIAAGRNVAKINDALREYAGDTLLVTALDVTNPAEVLASVDRGIAEFGAVDVLLNNAGGGVFGNFEELDWADIEWQYRVNVFGVMHVLRAVLPVMRRQRCGTILNISSGGGIQGFAQSTAYGATKFAVEGLTLALAQEVEQFGIRTVLVEPGMFRTDLLSEASVRYTAPSIDDYSHLIPARDAWAPVNGTQAGDPAKFGKVMVQVAGMAEPPRILAVGKDVLGIIETMTAERRQQAAKFAQLSSSTDFDAAH